MANPNNTRHNDEAPGESADSGFKHRYQAWQEIYDWAQKNRKNSENAESERARAYNEAHKEEMEQNWQEGQGLESKKSESLDDAAERARTYNEAHGEEMYQNWQEGQGIEANPGNSGKDDLESRIKMRAQEILADNDGLIDPEAAEARARKEIEDAEKAKNDAIQMRAQEILADNDGLIDPEAAEARARKEIEDAEKAKAEADEKAEAEADEKNEAEDDEKTEAETGEKAETEKTEESDTDKERREKEKRVERLEKEEKMLLQKEALDKLRVDLAEAYAKNRRLFVGKKNRAEFARLKEAYEKQLNEYLKTKSELAYESGQDKIGKELDNSFKKAGEEINKKVAELSEGKSPEDIEKLKNQLMEEANELIKVEYQGLTKELKDTINADFLNDFIKEQGALQESTVNQLDNGTLCRKFVSKVLNNKALKGVLAGAAIAGLAGALIASGGAISLAYTAGGVALGAGKGALMGGLMSRQDSKNSAVRRLASEEEIRKKLEGIDVTAESPDVKNVVKWLTSQYEEANKTDARSNKKRTAVSAGLGAVIGGAMSGVQVGNMTKTNVDQQEVVGHRPTEVHSNINNISHEQGRGLDRLFEELGGDPDKFYSSGAYDAYVQIGQNYGLQVGQSGWTFPGSINGGEWTEVARCVAQEASDTWARNGWVDQIITGGEPIYGTITHTVEQSVPNLFLNFLAKASGTTAGATIAGSVIAGRANRAPEANAPRITRTESATSTPDDLPQFNPSRPAPTGEGTPAPTSEGAPAPTGEGAPAPTGEGAPAPTGEGASTTTGEGSVPPELEAYRDRIGEDGIRFFSEVLPTDDRNMETMMANWWNNLTEDGRNAAIEYANTVPNDANQPGGALKLWIGTQLSARGDAAAGEAA